MPINMLMFEFRETEKSFFENNIFEDYNITFFEECLNEEFVKTLSPELLEQTTVISVFLNSNVSKTVIGRFKNLRIISTRTSSYDNVCLNTCEDKNIALINVPNYVETSAAQYTMGLIFALVRNIVPASKMLKDDSEKCNTFIGRDITKLTLAIIGTGAVGAEVCSLAAPMGMKVVANDLTARQELIDKYNVEYLSTEELAKTADVITVHIPYSPENYHKFDEKFFAGCKQNSYFVNTSNSSLIDMGALYKYVENGRIKGAAMDIVTCASICFKCKNLSDKLGKNHLECLEESLNIEKLRKHENVIITPHIAYATLDAIESILEETMANIKNTIKGDKMCRIV